MITVITICLNCENVIEKTINSVVSQVETEIEYIIKDGHSIDNTNNLVKKMIKECKNENVHFKHIISSDSGIYDAMNQAIEKASGEWVIFMNAGDCFFNQYVLKDSYQFMSNTEYDVLYGNTVYLLNPKYFFVQIHNIAEMKDYCSLGHQSTFVKLDIIKNNLFDIQYKIAGDYEFFRRIMEKKKKFLYINMIISICDREGVSARKTMLMYEENWQVKYGDKEVKKYKYYNGMLIWKLKSYIAKILPIFEQWKFCQNNMKRLRHRI